jgi:hypothetical protein
MSTNTAKTPFETPVEQTAQRANLDQPSERGGPKDARPERRRSVEALGLAAAMVATLVTYGIFLIYPYDHGSLNTFLATFARNNAAVWPMQLVWYICAVAMIGLAFWPSRRATQLICMLAAADLACEGIVYFGLQRSDMNLAWLWAAVFVLEAMLFLLAGTLRRDLVIAPRWNLASVLGGVFILYALLGYPLMGLLGGHPLSTLPTFGLAPCATVIFCFGVLLWARSPAPLYLLPVLLAWALCAAPPMIAMGFVADGGLVVAGVFTAGVLIWRDRVSTWQTVAAGLLLALMIAWSGHDNILIGIALVLVALMLAQTLRNNASRLSAGQLPRR